MEQLLKSIDLELHQDQLTTKKGIYFWFDRTSNECVYIGIACNKNGLKGRISRQHLNPKYLEFRDHRHTTYDDYQLSYAVIKISSKGTEKKGIDKSSFRKSIGRKLKLKPGEETCSYIHSNLTLKVYEHENEQYLKNLEKEMIKKYQPKFNTSLK